MNGMNLSQENLRRGDSVVLRVYLGLALIQLVGFGGAIFKIWAGNPACLLVGAIVMGVAVPICRIVLARAKNLPHLAYFLFGLFLADLGLIIYAYGNHILAHSLWIAPVSLTLIYLNPKLTIFAACWAVLEAVAVSCFLPPTLIGALSVDAPNLVGLIIVAVFNLFLSFFTLVYIVKRNRGFVDSLLALEEEGAERLSKAQDLLNQILTTGQILNQTSRELAANTDQVGASASVINQKTADNIRNIKKVLQVIKENKDTLERNRGYTMETVRIIKGIVSNTQSGVAMSAEMDEIVDEFKGKLNQTFATFRESGDQFISIQTIVETINDISSQINLLSLNAAIEAARAGEHGRGFSIIAEAIQNLSNQTGTALNRIKEVIANVSEQTDKIQKESKETGELFGKVLEVVLNVHGNIAAIAKRLNEKTPVLLKLTEFLQAQTQILAGVNNDVTGVYDFSVNTDQQARELLMVIEGVKKSVGNINSAAAELSTLSKALTTQEEPE